jgi:KipI family sensor histidine kinase inhibitor
MVVFGDTIDEATNDRVQALNRALSSQPISGVTETLPAYCTLEVFYDPLLIAYDDLCAALLLRVSSGVTFDVNKEAARTIVIPVCYGSEFGPDLAYVAEHAGLTEDEVVTLHSGVDYRIYMLGFLPGFPYLGGLDERIVTPRLTTPRTVIPAGAVGIGGAQTGIYPIPSPGGWQLIGATPLRVYDPARAPAILYRAGDFIRFKPIDKSEYLRLAAEAGGAP